jgi:hypothetical protein
VKLPRGLPRGVSSNVMVSSRKRELLGEIVPNWTKGETR